MSVCIIDYGMSNLGSIHRALEECGAEVFISEDPKDLATAERIVLPGVGAFKDGMKNLRSRGWIEPLKQEVWENKIPLLGICLGMQLLAEKGYEGGENEGLGLIKGSVKMLEPKDQEERIPHIGWNEIYRVNDDPLFEHIPDGADFYFVHSYHFIPADKKCILTRTPYCGNFVSSIHSGNVYGVQFHPEKSIPTGFQLLKNFLQV
ncbi:MAG: imidazole glycerol phosphate synthase subunit HisH [Spirochaetes bacterium]|nr:imidazole glycerol phosphate synthase subunit HisH [Spirochaetota bacterium]